MAHWIIRLDEVFKPLIHLMREAQNSAAYLQADETRIQVLKEDGKTAQSDKWMWVTRGGPPGQPSVLFAYDPSRSGAVPVRLLDDFKGVLQADGYSGYAQICSANKLTRSENAKEAIGADSYDTWGVSASYDAGFATFAADYSSTDEIADLYNIAVSFPVASTTSMAIGMVNEDFDAGDDITEWYANVTYKFPTQKNVSLFAEIADSDEDGADMGYLAGMRVKF
jgi:hypothetical protein